MTSTPYNFAGTRCGYIPYGYKLHPEVCPTGQLKLFKFAPGKFVSFFIPEKYIPLQSARNAYHLVQYRAANSFSVRIQDVRRASVGDCFF